jgi:hypothetical protein
MATSGNSSQVVNLGSVGGMGSSATAGAFNAGPQIAAKGGLVDSGIGAKGNLKPGGNVLVGGHFGPTTSAANAASGYNQGDQFAGTAGDTGTGPGAKGNLKPGGDVRNGPGKSAPAASGYAQGDQFAASKK